MKEVKIKLDDTSLEILKEVDSIHRESVINFGIRLASQTDYFKILKGEVEANELISITNIKIDSFKSFISSSDSLIFL